MMLLLFVYGASKFCWGFAEIKLSLAKRVVQCSVC